MSLVLLACGWGLILQRNVPEKKQDAKSIIYGLLHAITCWICEIRETQHNFIYQIIIFVT